MMHEVTTRASVGIPTKIVAHPIKVRVLTGSYARYYHHRAIGCKEKNRGGHEGQIDALRRGWLKGGIVVRQAMPMPCSA
jgi:hypothetical protein